MQSVAGSGWRRFVFFWGVIFEGFGPHDLPDAGAGVNTCNRHADSPICPLNGFAAK
jgi:hypothetical protein